MGEWIECTLGDIVTFQRGHDLPKTKMTGEGYPVAGSNGIIGYHSEFTTKAPAITIGRSGNVGNPYIYYENIWAHNTTLYVKEYKNVSPEFVYYFLKTLDLGSFAGGSAVPTLNRNHIHTLPVRIPKCKEDQKAIADILRTFDKKIEANAAINRNLLEQAQALFKSWFVDFEPYGRKMPDDWEVGNLLDIAEYTNGLAMQKFRPKDGEEGLPVLKIKELRQGSIDNETELCSPSIKDDYKVYDGDVIFSWSGSLLVDLWCGGKCGLNQHLFKVTSKKYDKWFYYCWTQFHLQKFIALAADMATTMGHIKRGELEKSAVIIPNKEDYVSVSQIMQPIIDLIIKKRVENKMLANLRDTLLPKLMSGELDVTDLNI